MIDYLRLHQTIHIPHQTFSPMLWKTYESKTGEKVYWYYKRGVKIRYYISTDTMTIEGKLLMLLYDTQVQNFDDIYGAERELFIDDINRTINNLFTSPLLDIREFTVTRIDYCFNVETPYVHHYIDFLTRAFRATNKNTRKNYTEEHNLWGSIYVKTSSDYNDNCNKNYTLNFYDKTNRLEYQRAHGERVTDADFILAQNILRLEIQCGYQMIKQLCNKFNVEKTFGGLFDHKIAIDAIISVYTRVFKGNVSEDIYSYQKAKNLLKGRTVAEKTIYTASTNHNICGKKYAYGRKLVQQAGIYPYCFLPKDAEVNYLENPLKLLLQKARIFDRS